MNNNFYNDLKSFYHEHPLITMGTLGFAAVGSSIAKLAGRAITWIQTELLGTTKKVNDVQRTIIPLNSEPNHYVYNIISPEGRLGVDGPVNIKLSELKKLVVQLPRFNKQNVEDLELRYGTKVLDDNLTWDEYVRDFSGTEQTVDKVVLTIKKRFPPLQLDK